MGTPPKFTRFLRTASPALLLLAVAVCAAGAPSPPVIQDNRLPLGVVGAPYAYFALTALGGTAPYRFSVFSGSLPAGITMDGTGLFQGTPTAPGSFPVTFQVQDASSLASTKLLTLTVNPPGVPPQWSARGLAGGTIRDIFISPDYAADATLFSLGESNEVNRSNDQGGSWSHTIVEPANPGRPVDGFALSPTFSMSGTADEEAQTVFASTGGGMYKSTDHGDSYEFVGSTLPDGATRIAISPNYAGDHTLVVAGYQQGFGTRIFRSTDRGLSYVPIATLPALTNGVQQIVISPNYAADQTLFLIGVNSPDVYRSLNGGASWTVVYSLPPVASNALQVAISPDYATDQTLFVAGNYNIYRSVNGGASFTLQRYWTVGMVSMAMVKRPSQTPLLYYMTYDSPQYMIFMSDDYAVTSTPLYSDGVRTPTYGLAASPLLAGGMPDLYTHGSLGVDLSQDNGFSFSPRDAGLNAFVINGIVGSGTVVIAGGENGWFKSTNAGTGWVRKKFPFSTDTFALYPAISPNYAADETVFITNTQEVWRSTDGGATFTLALTVPPAYYYPGFAIAPGFTPASGVVFAGTQSGGLWKSVNGGQSFSLVTGGGGCPLTGASTVTSAAVSPHFTTDRTVFITAGPDSSSSRLCRSTDGGATWTLLRAAATYNVALSPLYDQAAPNGTLAKMLIISDGSDFSQLLRSLDGGATFTGTGSYANAQPQYSPLFGLDGTILVDDYYGTNGILRSSDFGVSFAPLGPSDPLGVRIVSGIYLAPGFDGRNSAGSPALAGTQGSGVWQSGDGGRSFYPLYGYETLCPVLTALARGPGDAASTPILAATADQGIYRSTDGGDTFDNFSAGLPGDAYATAIAVPSSAAANPVTAVTGDEAGIYRYNGTAWVLAASAPAGSYANFLEFPNPVGGNFLYAARADGTSVRSADNGVTWSDQDAGQPDLVGLDFNGQTGPTLPQPALLAPRFVAANTASLWSVSQASGARYSNDSGATWIPAVGAGDYALPDGAGYTAVRALGINPASGSREVLVGSVAGLYRTADGGQKWRDASAPGSGLEATSRNFSAFVTSPTPSGSTDILTGILGASTGGVYLSGDGGEHWTQVNQGFDPNSLNITTLIKTSCNGCPVQYYTGTYGSGMYTRTIPVVAPPAVTGWCFTGTGCACGTAAMSGPEQGGQAFRLCGAGFQALPVVEFDGVAASGCSMVNAAVITCTGTPAHLPGTVALRVRNTDTRAGYAGQNYTYGSGAARAITLTKISKSGADAAIAWSCAGGACASLPVQLYRSQNVAFTLNLEHTTGATGASGSIAAPGVLDPAANPLYFWKAE